MKGMLIVFMLALGMLTVFGHECILLAYKFKVAKGDTLEMHLFLADGFNIQLEKPVQKSITKKFELITAGKTTELLTNAVDKALPILNMKADFEGLGLFNMERAYFHISLPTDKFREYLKDDHIENIDVSNDAPAKIAKRNLQPLRQSIGSGWQPAGRYII